MPLILTEPELRRLVRVDLEAVEAIERAFTWLAQGRVTMPPIMHLEVGRAGDVDIKAAYVEGLDRFAVKLGAGFFGNHKLGLPNSPAMMVVLSSRTGMPEAVLLDNAYLTDVRTGAAGAVAARHLAPKVVRTAGQIGAGVQGRFQMTGLKAVRDFKRLIIYDLDRDRLEGYREEMSGLLGVEVILASGPEEVVRESQVVVTSTPARKPYLQAGWLHPGLHLTAMGADLPDKQELEAEVLARADLLVCDRKTQALAMGELHHGLTAGVLTPESVIVELGEITSGSRPGRTSESQITLCDLTGTGVQDTAIADLALTKAARAGVGTSIG